MVSQAREMIVFVPGLSAKEQGASMARLTDGMEQYAKSKKHMPGCGGWRSGYGWKTYAPAADTHQSPTAPAAPGRLLQFGFSIQTLHGFGAGRTFHPSPLLACPPQLVATSSILNRSVEQRRHRALDQHHNDGELAELDREVGERFVHVVSMAGTVARKCPETLAHRRPGPTIPQVAPPAP
jgi:hypothetical protein